MRYLPTWRWSYERRVDNESGATLIIVAICSTLFLWACAFSVDLGIQTVGNRQLQAVADAGALDAAKYIDVTGTNLLTRAAQYAAKDNSSTATMTAVLGYWTGTQYVPAAGHCSSATPYLYPPCNAVKVTASEYVNELFHGGSSLLSRSAIGAINVPCAPGLVGCPSHTPPPTTTTTTTCTGSGCTTTSTSTTTTTTMPTCSTTTTSTSTTTSTTMAGGDAGGEAGFSIGTYLVTYSSTQTIILNSLLSELGTSVNLAAVVYQGLAQTNVTLLQLISASGGVLTPTNILTASLTGKDWAAVFAAATGNASLSTLADSFSSATSTSLGQLVSINGTPTGPPDACGNTTLSPAELSTSINVLQTLTTEAELANGTNAIDVTAALSLPGVSTANLILTLLQPAQYGYGPTGSTASTSQVNAELDLNVTGIGQLDMTFTGADGTATLYTVTCTNNAMNTIKINASTTAVTGSVTLAGLAIATLGVSGVSIQTLPYNNLVVPPTATTAANDTNPIAIGTTSPSFTLSGMSAANTQLVGTLLNVTLEATLPVLQPLGVSVGGADVAALTSNCDAALLES